MLWHAFSKRQVGLVEDRAWHAWGLYRPSSVICSGTGRPARLFEILGTVPTTERYMLGDWSTSLPIWNSGDCIDHRALYARGLVDQPTHLKFWGLYRPPSVICSGTGRPAHPFGILRTVPTTEHYMLGDWTTSPPIWNSGDCIDHRALYARGQVDQPAHLEFWGLDRPPSVICSGTGRPAYPFEFLGTVPTTERYMLEDWLTSLLHRRRARYARGLVNSIA